jgi:hypothetical protein
VGDGNRADVGGNRASRSADTSSSEDWLSGVAPRDWGGKAAPRSRGGRRSWAKRLHQLGTGGMSSWESRVGCRRARVMHHGVWMKFGRMVSAGMPSPVQPAGGRGWRVIGGVRCMPPSMRVGSVQGAGAVRWLSGSRGLAVRVAGPTSHGSLQPTSSELGRGAVSKFAVMRTLTMKRIHQSSARCTALADQVASQNPLGHDNMASLCCHVISRSTGKRRTSPATSILCHTEVISGMQPQWARSNQAMCILCNHVHHFHAAAIVPLEGQGLAV